MGIQSAISSLVECFFTVDPPHCLLRRQKAQDEIACFYEDWPEDTMTKAGRNTLSAMV